MTAQEKGIGRRKNGKPVVFEKPEVKEIRAMFRDMIGSKLKEINADVKFPINGPVFLATVFYWKEDDKHPFGTFKTTKPDTDNLVKLLKDSITDVGIWKDDSQVAGEQICKQYWSIPGIFIRIEVPDDGQDHE